MITYEVPNNLDEKEYVNVTFKNEKGEIFTKMVNIPRNDDGSINQEYFNEILEGQLKGVENKVKMGAIKFVLPETILDPSSVPETVKDTI